MIWPFGDNRTLITRGQTHSYIEKANDKIEYTNIYAMNQWRAASASTAWKHVETDKSSILSQELTDNSTRVSKWALQTMFAGADSMKILFVKRQKLAFNKKHMVMGKL